MWTPLALRGGGECADDTAGGVVQAEAVTVGAQGERLAEAESGDVGVHRRVVGVTSGEAQVDVLQAQECGCPPAQR